MLLDSFEYSALSAVIINKDTEARHSAQVTRQEEAQSVDLWHYIRSSNRSDTFCLDYRHEALSLNASSGVPSLCDVQQRPRFVLHYPNLSTE